MRMGDGAGLASTIEALSACGDFAYRRGHAGTL